MARSPAAGRRRRCGPRCSAWPMPGAAGSRSTSRRRRGSGRTRTPAPGSWTRTAALTAELGDDVHLSLAITGGSADAAGIDTFLAGAYASLALDLIDGPDNWRLATAWPADRGLICGALSTREGSDDGPELLLWAARYGASTRGRGPARVGLATAGSLAALSWDVAAEKVRRLGEPRGWRPHPSMNSSPPSIPAPSTSAARRWVGTSLRRHDRSDEADLAKRDAVRHLGRSRAAMPQVRLVRDFDVQRGAVVL